jgi:hypothetical protein
MVCPHCMKPGLRVPFKALFSRRAEVPCDLCGVKTVSQLGLIVDVKNFISGVVGMGLLMLFFFVLWGRWFLLPLVFVFFVAIDAWVMATLHRRNLRRIALDSARAGVKAPTRS